MAAHRIAIVGPAGSGACTPGTSARIATLELVAVADPEPVDLDAVVLGSPTALHAEQVAAFAGAGEHVFCKKPISADLAGADRALAAAEAAALSAAQSRIVRLDELE